MEDPDSLVDLLDELPDLICRYLPDGTIVYVNRSYAEYFGGEPASLHGTNILELLPSGLREGVEADIRSLRELRPQQPVAVNEHRSTDRHGRGRRHAPKRGRPADVPAQVPPLPWLLSDRRVALDAR